MNEIFRYKPLIYVFVGLYIALYYSNSFLLSISTSPPLMIVFCVAVVWLTFFAVMKFGNFFNIRFNRKGLTRISIYLIIISFIIFYYFLNPTIQFIFAATSTSITVWINGSTSQQNFTSGDKINITAQIAPAGLQVCLSMNATPAGSGGYGNAFQCGVTTVTNFTDSSTLAKETGYNVTADFTPGGDYTASTAINWFNVTKIKSILTLRNNSASVNNSQLVGYWRFDEGSGSIAYDSSGYDNTGYLLNSPSWVDGRFGKALSFTGTSSTTVNINRPSNIPIGSHARSMFAWVKTTDASSAIVEYHGGGCSPAGNSVGMLITGTGNFYIATWCNDFDTGKVINDGNWHFVGFTMADNTNQLTAYVDDIAYPGTWSLGIPYTTSVSWISIGGPTWGYYDGIIDEVQIWNRALTPDEIRMLYESRATYNTQTNFTCWANNAEVTPQLFKNMTGPIAGVSDVQNLSANYYQYACNSSATANYARSSLSLPLNVTKTQPVLVLSNNTASVNTSQLVGYWRFEGTNSSATDYSGYGNDGTYKNGATTAVGRFGNGVTTASNAYISIPVVDISTEWSIAVWFLSPLPNPAGGWATLTRGTNDHQILAYEGKSLGSYDNAGGTGFHYCGWGIGNATSNQWHHLVAVGNSTGYTNFYIDGVWMCASDFRSTADVVSIGNYQGGGQPWGTFDEVQIYNRSLTAEEIRELYESSAGNYPVTTIFKGSNCPNSTTGGKDVFCGLYRNETNSTFTNATNESVILGAGYNYYIFNTSGGANYTRSSMLLPLNITKITSSISVTLTNNNTDYGTQTTASCSVTIGDSSATLTLFRNGTQVATGTTPIQEQKTLAAGNHNYTCTYTESQNYTSSSTTSWMYVNKAKPTLILSNNTATVNTSQLVGYWRFEGTNSSATDYSGYGNDGTYKNGATTAVGRFGNAASFDGVDDYINCGNSNSLNAINEITITMWIKSNNQTASYLPIVSKQFSYDVEFTTAAEKREVQLWLNLSTGNAYSPAYTLPANKWTYVAFGYNGTDTFTFINGEIVDWWPYTGSINTIDKPLVIGAQEPYWGYSNTTVDEVQIYNRSLTAEEIREMYESSAGNYPVTTIFKGSNCPNATNGNNDVFCSLYRNETNSTFTNATNESVILGAGYYYYIFNTSGGANYTQSSILLPLNITKTTISNFIDVMLNDVRADRTMTYPNEAKAAGFFNSTGATDITFKLYRNNADLTSDNNTAMKYPVGTYQFIFGMASGTYANWTAGNSSIKTLTVNQNSTNPVDIYFINSSGIYKNQNMTIFYGTNTTANATMVYPDAGTANLYEEETLMSNPWMTTLAVGSHPYKGNTSGNANYTTNATGNTFYINVNKAATTCWINSSAGWSYTYGMTTILQCNCTGDGTKHLYYGGVQYDSYNATAMTLAVTTSSSVVCNTTETASYNSATASNTLTIAKASQTTTLQLNGTSSNKIYPQNKTVNLTAYSNASAPTSTIYSNFTGTLQQIAAGAGTVTNYTDATNLAYVTYFILANSTANENYTASASVNYNMTVVGLVTTCEAGGPYTQDSKVFIVGNTSYSDGSVAQSSVTVNIRKSGVLHNTTTITTSSSGKYSVSFTGIEVGDYTVTVTATHAGNTSSCSDTFSVQSSGVACSNSKSISISGTAIDYTTGQLIQSGTVYGAIKETSDAASATIANGRWSLTFSACLTAGDRYTLALKITSSDGKSSYSQLQFMAP